MKKALTKKALVGLALVLLASFGAGSALAQDPVRPPNHIISFTGTIVDIDAATARIEVTIQMTNNPYIGRRGDTVWVDTTAATLYYVWDGVSRTATTFDYLQEFQKVSINAVVGETTITASRVEVDKRAY
jgi:hypothetical protein